MTTQQTSSGEHSQALRRHRQNVRLEIILPVALPFAIMIIMSIALFLFATVGDIEAQQITVIMSIMLTLCALLPLAIVMLVLNAVVLLAMFGAGTLEQHIQKPLEAARRYTARGAQTTQEAALRISEPIIAARSRAARWRVFATRLFET